MVDLALLQSVSYIAGALGVCVAAVYYVMNLRISQKNQELTLKTQHQNIETRQAQLFMGIAQNAFSREFLEGFYRLNKIKLDNIEDMRNLMSGDKENYFAFDMYASYYESIGILVKNNLVDIRLVSQMISGNVISLRARAKYLWYGSHLKWTLCPP